MVLTGGLFKRFKCFLTSNLWREAVSLAAEDREIRSEKQRRSNRGVGVAPMIPFTLKIQKKNADALLHSHTAML
ncbi:uncharacterized protein G2W53_005425 [Senna tora]|uniref:Uncharacterized protein n=1 Tax=Senna tora TaxID=362788 RepID=A0A834X2D8_9FABA|nr:uncharacterized protein G2W53_005425 [Senna tora]